MEELDSSAVIIIGVVGIILILFFLLFYIWRKLTSDFAIYKSNRDALILASAAAGNVVAEDGEAGVNGRDAYEIYKDTYNDPNITYEEYEAKFFGVDGDNGADAPPAINGSHGDDGSTGEDGDVGISGNKGLDGSKGVQGVVGDTFVNVYVSSNTANDPIRDLGSSLAPVGHPSCAFISNLSSNNTPSIRYFYKGKLITRITVTSWTRTAGYSDGHVSFIVYDKNSNVIGITDPITLYTFNTNNNINFSVTEVANTGYDPLRYRAIVSLNRGITMAAFTPNVIEKNLMNKSFVYTRAAELDPFVNHFYDVISTNASLKKDPTEFFEKAYISPSEVSLISSINFSQV